MPTADELLGPQVAGDLVAELSAADPGNTFAATRSAAAALDTLSLGARARALAAGIVTDLDGDHRRLAEVIRRANAGPGFRGWLIWPAGLAVTTTALEDGTTHAFDDAMRLHKELTPGLTSEFAIRPMLRRDLHRALAIMTEWTTDPDAHVRRLASEGSRPFLPWAERLPAVAADPRTTAPILDALHDDPEDYVARSVANHLNDHSRNHPDFAVETVRGWFGDEAHSASTARHALRTLVKRGHPGALELLGFPPADVIATPLLISPALVRLGGRAAFEATIENRGAADTDLVIDYVLFFPDARGVDRTKVFKLTRRRLAAGERAVVTGAHPFREISTRRYYGGRHGIALQINGVVHERADVELRV